MKLNEIRQQSEEEGKVLLTLTTDNFFYNASWAQKFTYIRTRFVKIGIDSVKIVTGLIKETRHFLVYKIESVLLVTCHSLKSSICSGCSYHSLAFSGLFQASYSSLSGEGLTGLDRQ